MSRARSAAAIASNVKRVTARGEYSGDNNFKDGRWQHQHGPQPSDQQSEIILSASVPVAIVGAGPYGLSLAAHLAHRQIPFRIFGEPMQVWRQQMPSGMHLKSDGFASDLYDPERSFTLKRYCAAHQIDYADYGVPVRRGTFVDYALEFQKKFVSSLEPIEVTAIGRTAEGFSVRLQNDQTFTARTVVMATGISYFSHVPEALSSLPPELCTHSSAHHDLAGFHGKRVAVIGGGASATDLAALLHQAGALVQLISRSPPKFHLPPDGRSRSLIKRLREPNLGLGPGLKSAIYTEFPGLFRQLPRDLRLRIVRRHLGPAGGWFMKEHVEGKVGMYSRHSLSAAAEHSGTVTLTLVDTEGRSTELVADHAIAATGYHVSMARLRLLDPAVRASLAQYEQSPALSAYFESTVPGLYFIGVAAANTFGPLMRFALGAKYTAKRLSARLEGAHGSERSLVGARASAQS